MEGVKTGRSCRRVRDKSAYPKRNVPSGDKYGPRQHHGAAAASGIGGYRVIGGLPGMEHHRALAAGAGEEEIAKVLLAIAPVAGLGRAMTAAPEVAAALGYDIDAALLEPEGRPEGSLAGEAISPSARN